jgi:hypothetical protein
MLKRLTENTKLHDIILLGFLSIFAKERLMVFIT